MNRSAALLIAGMLAGAAPQDDPIESRVYNVEFLTKRIRDFPGASLGLQEGGDAFSEECEGSSFLPDEMLCDLIRHNVAEDSWAHAKAGIHFDSGILTITNRRSIHEKIGAYLAYWRGFLARMITIDASVLLIDPELLEKIRGASPAGRPAVFTPEQMRRIDEAAREGKEARRVKSMRVSAFNGQRVNLQDTTQHQYIGDYDSQTATGSALLDPVFSQYSTGFVLDVRAFWEPFGTAVTLEVRGTVADPVSVGERTVKLLRDVGAAGDKGNDRLRSGRTEVKIHLPQVSVTSVRTTVTIRNRESALAGLVQSGNQCLAFFLTPSVHSLEDRPAGEPAFEEQRLLRLYDVSSLTRALTDFPGPRTEVLVGRVGMRTGAAFGVLEEGIR
ncbi:MAG: hypothetical protein HY716_13345 [Planctomycetes bacterium]|nr:hypothetical protein [Planctomycetota bacterium]